MRARIAEIDAKASVLLEGASPETRGFIDAKLRDLATEKRRHQEQLVELEATPYDAFDADAVLSSWMAALNDLSRLLKHGTLEERKQFIRSFVVGVTVQPETGTLDV